MNGIEISLDRSARLLVAVAATGLICMMLHVVLDVVLDAVIGRPIAGTAEVVAYYYMVAAVFLPLPLVEMRGESINVDLFYGLAPRILRRFMLVIAYVAQTIFFFVLAWQSGIDAIKSFGKGEMIEGRLDVFLWPGRLCLPIAFGLGALVSVLLVLKVLSNPDFTPEDPMQNETGGKL